MNSWKKLVVFILTVCLLWGCGAAEAEVPTTVPTEQEQTQPPTEAPTEPAPTEAPDPMVTAARQTVLPEEDAATGTLKLYFNDQQIYAGGPVANILEAGVFSYDDFDLLLQPGHISDDLRAVIQVEGVHTLEGPAFTFTAFNPTEEPRPISECLIYGLSVNMESGVEFGSGNEDTAFVTGKSQYEELVAVYGEPDHLYDHVDAYGVRYVEAAYYEPFNYVYFAFKNGTVRQIMTVYSAQAHGALAEGYDHELEGYFGNDGYILMAQYLDVEPYLDGAETEDRVKALDEFITLGGMKIELGCLVSEMPEQFAKPFEELRQYFGGNYYIRTGKDNEEEFYLLNKDGLAGGVVSKMTVLGVITQNPNYVNWGFDLSGFFPFAYQGLDCESTIEDVLQVLGQPKQLQVTSSPKACFVWMNYEDEAGNTVQICVDPMVNQITEIRLMQYYEKARHY